MFWRARRIYSTRRFRAQGAVGATTAGVWQDVFVTSATTAARAGAQVAQTPHHTWALWNHYQILPKLGAGLGILNRPDMFAAIDNTPRASVFRATWRICSTGNT